MYKLGYWDIGIFHFLHGLSNKIADKYQKYKAGIWYHLLLRMNNNKWSIFGVVAHIQTTDETNRRFHMNLN